MLRRHALGLLAASASLALAPGTARAGDRRSPWRKPGKTVMAGSARKVFAHWHFFPRSIDNLPPAQDYYATQFLTVNGEGGKHASYGGYLRERPLGRDPLGGDWQLADMQAEVTRAATVGIDGFQFNILDVSPNQRYWTRFTTMVAAAEAVGGGTFKIIPNIDCSTVPAGAAALTADQLVSVASRPGVYKLSDGRMVVSCFGAENWGAGTWGGVVDRMGAAGVKVAFIPVFVEWQDPAGWPFAYGMGSWGPGTVPDLPALSPRAGATHAAGKVWMAPVRPQDFRAYSQSYWEAGGSAMYRGCWDQATKDAAEFVQLITWNDYGEGSEIQPSTGIQFAFCDLTGYYAARFKLGRAPTMQGDVLYYFHRIESVNARPDLSKQTAGPFRALGSAPPVDRIEVLAMLTAPGTVEIVTSAGATAVDVQAGVTSITAPLATGVPHFRLLRSGAPVLELDSAFHVRDAIIYQDLLYRAGSSDRRPVAGVADPA